MGCCGSEPSPVMEQRPTNMTLGIKGGLTIYGDYFDSDTRTIVTLLNIVDQNFKFNEIDIFQGQQAKADFLSVNPLGTIPVVTD